MWSHLPLNNEDPPPAGSGWDEGNCKSRPRDVTTVEGPWTGASRGDLSVAGAEKELVRVDRVSNQITRRNVKKDVCIS